MTNTWGRSSSELRMNLAKALKTVMAEIEDDHFGQAKDYAMIVGDIVDDLHKAKMAEAHDRFIQAGRALAEVWREDIVKCYPGYLPSFDEFLLDFAELFNGPDPDRDNEL